ncbi:MAG: NTP/NDP exchange transporter [Alphaproteobacteria bacterium]|nr:NTP/NDP exchange transporter [Alphaproteobacteria bacterium]NCQ66655.1 NTP/NDP exchange transporter [Alphaproteobacteria bacterium]NCT07007.1 NTP/NDP exchange transporter [Alphaproteobacteria bacterium]
MSTPSSTTTASTQKSAPPTPLAFSTLRKLFWPIHGNEVKKFLPMAVIMFFILFNYTLLRNMKDALVITASGPEVLPFLKAFVILPFSILIVAGYAKLCNIFDRKTVFYIVITLFLSVYVTYALFIHPNIEHLHMSPERLKALKESYPNFQHFFSVIANWSSSLFYLCAELWGATIIGLLFWQFANEVTRVQEARRFYTMFGLLGHFSLIAAGKLGEFLCDIRHTTATDAEGWSYYINYNVLAISLSGLSIIVLYWWMNRYVLTDPQYYDEVNKISAKKEAKPKLSLMETVRYISRSRYLGYILLMVIGYGLSMNLAGILWKKQVQLLFPNPLDYANFLAQFAYWVGVITIVLIFFLKGMVERFGWYKAAMVTPLIVVGTAIPFFTFMFFQEELSPLLSWSGCTALTLAVGIGAAQQVLSKSSKYSMFDPTKEMSYIPLDQELKVKGKAAVDVSGYSLAKASGGYIAGALLVITAAGDLMLIAPYLAAIVIGILVVWIIAVKKLSVLYRGLVNTAKSRDVETFTSSKIRIK